MKSESDISMESSSSIHTDVNTESVEIGAASGLSTTWLYTNNSMMTTMLDVTNVDVVICCLRYYSCYV